MAKTVFKPPEGAVPEGTQTGDNFDMVCTFRLEAGGKVCLTQMGDLPMEGYENKSAYKERPPRNEEASAMAASAPPMAGPPGGMMGGPPTGGGGGGGY